MYKKNYLLTALKKIGIKKNSNVFIHSDIIKLPYNIKFKKNITVEKKIILSCDYILKTFQKIVGPNGIIAAPAFSYSYCKKEIYDIKKTKSNMGLFSNYLRRIKNSVRTNDPIVSVSIIGKKSQDILKKINISNNCFGGNSFFAQLYKENFFIIFLGTSLQVCTMIHRVEQISKVPYRFIKTFEGFTKINNAKFKTKHYYFCRYLRKYKQYDYGNTILYNFEKELLKKNKLIKPYKKFLISGIKARDFQNLAFNKIKRNKYIFLKKIK